MPATPFPPRPQWPTGPFSPEQFDEYDPYAGVQFHPGPGFGDEVPDVEQLGPVHQRDYRDAVAGAVPINYLPTQADQGVLSGSWTQQNGTWAAGAGLDLLGGMNQLLGQRNQERDFAQMQQRTGSTDFAGVQNPLNPFGNYTPNAGLGNNFQPTQHTPTQRQNYASGGQTTTLPPGQHVAYQRWLADNDVHESADYDMQAYWQHEGFKSAKHSGHFPDTYKRLDPFGDGDRYQQLSEESRYSGNPDYQNGGNGSFDKRGQGYWDGNTFQSYENGGEYQLSDEQIAELRAQGYELDELDELD